MDENWNLPGAVKDRQSITREWQFTNQNIIEGVVLKEVTHVPKNNGSLTEIYREEWRLDDAPVGQVFQVSLLPGGLSAWHSHELTTDRLFVNHGQIKIVLYDSRKSSATYGVVNEFRLGTIRPALLIVPPKVWHGTQNLSPEASLLLNLVDKAYQYEDPDHWRLPPDTDQIPYKFE